MWIKHVVSRILDALRIRKRIITGIITIVPVAVTVWIIYILGANFHKIFKPIITGVLQIKSPFLGFGISIFLMLLVVYIIGVLSAFLAVKRAISIGEKIVARIPFVKAIYSATKQVTDTIALPSRKVFKKVVLIEYPRPGFHSIAFVTGKTRIGENPERLISVFMPTTPNPTTGFHFMLTEHELKETDLTVAEGMRVLLSGGILVPHEIPTRPYTPELDTENDATTPPQE